MYNLAAFDTFQMQMLCAFLFFSGELKHGSVRTQIRVFDYNMFRTEFVKVSIYSCCIYANSLIFQIFFNVSNTDSNSLLSFQILQNNLPCFCGIWFSLSHYFVSFVCALS